MVEVPVPDEASLQLEAESVEDVMSSLEQAIALLLARALAAWAAGEVGEALQATLTTALKVVRWEPMTPALRDVAVKAVDLGVTVAVRDLPGRIRVRRPRIKVPDLDQVTRSRLSKVQDLVKVLPLDTKKDLDTVIGRVSSVRSRAAGQVRWTANDGVNAGTVAVARSVGQAVIWVPERDACLHCLAYAGWSVKPGDAFPEGLTYGDKALIRSDMRHPPLHPGCRCRVQLYRGEPGPPPEDRTLPDPAARLSAEARRSVVYGWTSYASNPATLRAMSRLLDRGAGLAPSVERRARERLRQGRTQPKSF